MLASSAQQPNIWHAISQYQNASAELPSDTQTHTHIMLIMGGIQGIYNSHKISVKIYVKANIYLDKCRFCIWFTTFKTTKALCIDSAS